MPGVLSSTASLLVSPYKKGAENISTAFTGKDIAFFERIARVALAIIEILIPVIGHFVAAVDRRYLFKDRAVDLTQTATGQGSVPPQTAPSASTDPAPVQPVTTKIDPATKPFAQAKRAALCNSKLLLVVGCVLLLGVPLILRAATSIQPTNPNFGNQTTVTHFNATCGTFERPSEGFCPAVFSAEEQLAFNASVPQLPLHPMSFPSDKPANASLVLSYPRCELSDKPATASQVVPAPKAARSVAQAPSQTMLFLSDKPANAYVQPSLNSSSNAPQVQSTFVAGVPKQEAAAIRVDQVAQQLEKPKLPSMNASPVDCGQDYPISFNNSHEYSQNNNEFYSNDGLATSGFTHLSDFQKIVGYALLNFVDFIIAKPVTALAGAGFGALVTGAAYVGAQAGSYSKKTKSVKKIATKPEAEKAAVVTAPNAAVTAPMVAVTVPPTVTTTSAPASQVKSAAPESKRPRSNSLPSSLTNKELEQAQSEYDRKAEAAVRNAEKREKAEQEKLDAEKAAKEEAALTPEKRVEKEIFEILSSIKVATKKFKSGHDVSNAVLGVLFSAINEKEIANIFFSRISVSNQGNFKIIATIKSFQDLSSPEESIRIGYEKDFGRFLQEKGYGRDFDNLKLVAKNQLLPLVKNTVAPAIKTSIRFNKG